VFVYGGSINPRKVFFGLFDTEDEGMWVICCQPSRRDIPGTLKLTLYLWEKH